MEGYALITGSSKGIGRAMAFALAKRGFNLLLVARSGDELKALKDILSVKFQVAVEVLPLDLSQPGSASQVAEWAKMYPVAALINNAGYGMWGNFADLSLDLQMNMLQLNISTLVELSHHILPILKQQPKSYILNVASTAAYQAVPTLGVYSASKAFVLSFTRALRFELKDTGVSVSCICPGPVDTGFAARAGLNALSKIAQTFNATPESVAEIAIKGMLKGKPELIPGITNVISAYATRFIPKSIIEKAAAGIYKLS